MAHLIQRIGKAAVILSSVLLLFSSWSVSPAGAQDNRNIKMDFEQIDIRVLVNFISELTGRNFIIDERVGGKITVRSPTGISVEEAYRVFESVLEVNGFTIVPSGGATKIVPSQTAKQRGIEVTRPGEFSARPDERFVTQLVFLKYAKAQEVYKLLLPLISQAGAVMAYGPTELIVLTDFSSNVQRLTKIIQELDFPVPPDATISILPLRNAGASKTAEQVTALLTAQAKRDDLPAEGAFKIVPDSRTNQILVYANDSRTKQVVSLVQALDQPTPFGQGNVNVVYLKNADALDLSKVITGLPIKATEKVGEQKEGAAPAPSELKIVADRATNSLIITADPEEFRVLEAMIRQLDIPRRQVFVEALIMEASMTKVLSLGINWNVGHSVGSTGGGFLGSNPGQIGSSLISTNSAGVSSLVPPNGLALGFVDQIKIGSLAITNLTSLAQAAQTDTDFNVISTPQLMTLDNEEAKVVVAQNIPYLTSQQTNTANTTGIATQNFDYKDVGTTLKVTPQISAKGTVRLKIYEEVSRIVSASQNVGSGNIVFAPTTTKRTAESRVEVQNGQTVVIAGLLGSDMDNTDNKVPGLGDIPGLGWLFKARNRTANKTNLLVFLTPHIVENVADAQAVYASKVDQVDILRLGTDGRAQAKLKPSVQSAPAMAR